MRFLLVGVSGNVMSMVYSCGMCVIYIFIYVLYYHHHDSILRVDIQNKNVIVIVTAT